jgi:hypothetical protein
MLACAPALAQPTFDPEASQVTIAYIDPINPEHIPIMERLKRRAVLEDLRDFMSPLRLPQRLTIKLEGCSGIVNAWYSAQSITICYEYVDWIRKSAPKSTTDEGITPEDAIVGPFVDVLLHELSHAVFDILKIPVFGREEDAADQLAAFILLQFGKDVARRTITGAALLYQQQAATQSPTANDFADTHGLPAQRFYNTLCIAYGWDRDLFNDFVLKGLLPVHRSQYCPFEYQQILHAYRTLIAPHVDPELEKKVRSREWLKSGDGR